MAVGAAWWINIYATAQKLDISTYRNGAVGSVTFPQQPNRNKIAPTIFSLSP
jgi:hypothetical protein